MRFTVQFSRILVGLLFVFSGLVKINDPSGTAIKLEEYFGKFAEDVSVTQDSFSVEIKKDNKIVQVQTKVLIAGEKEKELEFFSETQKEEDTAGNVKAYNYHFKVKADQSDFCDFPVVFTNSSWKEQLSVSVRAGKSLLYSNTFIIRANDSLAVKKGVSVATMVKPESSFNSFFKSCRKYSLTFSMIFCAVEIILGFALLIGWRIRIISWLLLLTILFFSLLTGYSWLAGYGATRWPLIFSLILVGFIVAFALIKKPKYRKYTAVAGIIILLLMTGLCFVGGWCFTCAFNPNKMKVTDCGCFGDFIKLKPWTSFYKDLILLVLILVIFYGKNFIKPLFSPGFGWKFMFVIATLTLGFGFYCYLYLPVWDFLPYKKGNNIAALMKYNPESGMPERDSVLQIWHMRKGTDSVAVSNEDKFTQYQEKGYEFVWVEQKLIVEGYKPPIHDFAINGAEASFTDSFLKSKQYHLIFVAPYTSQSYEGAFEEMAEIQKWCVQKKIKLYPLTSTSLDEATAFSKSKGWNTTWYNADEKVLKTMARYNPVLYLFKGTVVVDKWSGRWLPSTARLDKKISSQ